MRESVLVVIMDYSEEVEEKCERACRNEIEEIKGSWQTAECM